MSYQDFFKGKKVTQLGLGLLGRGVNDAIFILENGIKDLIVTDKKTEAELAPSVEKLKNYTNLILRLGEHRLEDFEDRDFILKGAGVPLDSPFIAHAKEKGIPIEMDSSLCVKLLPEGVTTIGVTGTRGKSTTTHLIAHILRQALGSRKLGTSQTETFVGGNVRDMATLPLLKEIKTGDFLVLELDSWQLQGFGDAGISPHVAVFINFMPDHLNYYGGDMDKYFDDKANIFKFQKEEDVIVVGEDLESRITNHESRKIVAKKSLIPRDWKIKIPGEHNLSNIACAVEACKALGISDQYIKEGVESFDGIEGRLQFVKEVKGVKIWNDNNSTTPSATIAALVALGESRIKNQESKKNMVLLCGGADKGLELDELIEKINKTCKAVVLLPGTGSKRIKNQESRIKIPLIEVSDLAEAVKTALSHCSPKDSLLFSPGFASFGLFKNEYERNDEFLRLIAKMV